MPAKIFMAVIPAKADTRGEHMDVFGFEERGIHVALMQKQRWIPAFAGMAAGKIEAFDDFVTVGRAD